MILRVLLASLCVLQCVAIGVLTSGDSSRPQLIIVHSDSCGPCRQFDCQWLQDAQFRAAIQKRFDVRALDWDISAQKQSAQTLGVSRLPSFVVETGSGWSAPIVGFLPTPDGKRDLLRQLTQASGVGAQTPTAPQPRVRAAASAQRDSPPIRTATQSTVDEEARRQLKQVTDTQRRIGDDLVELNSAVNRSLHEGTQTAQEVKSVRDSLSTIKTELGSTASRLTEQISRTREDSRRDTQTELKLFNETVRNTVHDTVTERINSTLSQPAAGGPQPITPTRETDGASGTAGTESHPLAGWLLKIGLTGAAASLGLPVAGAGVAAGVISWLITRRRARRTATTGTADNQVTVLRDQTTRRTTDTHYVVKETDRVGEAYKEALRRVCAAYKDERPGIVDVARQVEHVAQEIVRGQDVTARADKAPRPGIWDDNSEG